jgi:hypothetical protein
VIAYISGLPAEELLPALTGAGARLLVARGCIHGAGATRTKESGRYWMPRVAVVAWAVTDERMGGMDARPGTALGVAGWFVGVWAVMMAAMMFPSIAPMVEPASLPACSTSC